MNTRPETILTKRFPPNELKVLDLPVPRQFSPIPFQLAFICASYKDVSLAETECVALQDRFDTKFGLSSSQLMALLPELRTDYKMLAIKGQRLQPYSTLYFDTTDFDLYNLHVNERADQFKVRIRQYQTTEEAFLEVKHKTPNKRTVKNRIPLDPDLPFLGKDELMWLADFLPQDYLSLEPKMINHFTRLVLVDNQQTERVTLDFSIQFSSGCKSITANNVVIAEVKQKCKHQPSFIIDLMHRIHIREMGFSKYCVGLSLLEDQLKANAMKPHQLWLKRVNGGY